MISLKEKYIVDDNGNTTNVIITKKDYDRLVDYIEELEDIAAYDRAKHKKETPVKWNKVKRQSMYEILLTPSAVKD